MPANNLVNLMEAVYSAFNNAQPGKSWAPKLVEDRWWTYCNEAFNSICMAMGCNQFDKEETPNPRDAELANKIYDLLSNGNGWIRIPDVMEAQNHANEGFLVVASWKNPSGGPGHVCVLIPGRAEYSGTWQSYSPKVMNVGQSVFIGGKASLAFSKEKMPDYFMWVGLEEVRV